jgi:DNA-directed RNA polymerase subunit H (RpoH/RPB5)
VVQSRVISGAKAILQTRGYSNISVVEEEEHVDVLGSRREPDTGKEETIVVRIPEKEVVGVKVLRDYAKFSKDQGIDHAILLSRQKYTHYARKEAREEGIEIFSTNFPFFNLFEHALVPNHAFASKEEVERIQARYSIEVTQLPKITENDPAAQLLGAKPGQVLRITRSSPTAGEFIGYRLVVSAEE